MSAAVIHAADAPESADCRQALESMQRQEDVALAARQAEGPPDGRYQRAPDAKLETLRRQAARACLGARADSPPAPQRFAQPPIAVPPIGVARPALPRALPVAPVAVSPKPPAPPTIVIGCDPVGCWASDGSRLNRVGPNLLGPRGLCSVQGTLLTCP